MSNSVKYDPETTSIDGLKTSSDNTSQCKEGVAESPGASATVTQRRRIVYRLYHKPDYTLAEGLEWREGVSDSSSNYTTKQGKPCNKMWGIEYAPVTIELEDATVEVEQHLLIYHEEQASKFFSESYLPTNVYDCPPDVLQQLTKLESGTSLKSLSLIDYLEQVEKDNLATLNDLSATVKSADLERYSPGVRLDLFHPDAATTRYMPKILRKPPAHLV